MFTFSFYCYVKRKSEPKKKNTLFIGNPTDCSSPNGRTPCRFSSPPPLEGGGRISTRALRVLEIQGAGYSLKSLTAPIITARLKQIFDLSVCSSPV